MRIILVMKTNSIEKNIILDVHHVNIEALKEKQKSCKRISSIFKYLQVL
jgi:hypothetical protein